MRFLIIPILILTIGFIGFLFFQDKISSQSSEEEIRVFDFSLTDWMQTTSSVPWEARDAQTTVVFKDKLWLLGGVTGEECENGYCPYWTFTHRNDVWSSGDGNNWELITNIAEWGERRSLVAAVFKNKIWMMGGWGPFIGIKNDVWSSEDGINWVLATPSVNWAPREGHTVVVFNDKIWMMGGIDFDRKLTMNDVWYSEDGINWIEATTTIPWSPRYDHTTTVFNNKMWVIGGVAQQEEARNDVWVSDNGLDWQLVTAEAEWPARHGHTSVVYQDRIWLISGWNTQTGIGLKDVWYSADGYQWEKTQKEVAWEGREDHVSVVFKDKIWLMGGMDNNWTWKNDVWFSTLNHSNIDFKNSSDLPTYPFKVSIRQKLLANVSQTFQSKPIKKIVVDLSQQKASLFENNQLVDEFLISSGNKENPTPTGNFKVRTKINMVYSSIAGCWLPFWVGFTADGLYGFHEVPICEEGRKGLEKIGEPASIGCLRLGIENSEKLYKWVEIGDLVEIYEKIDEEKIVENKKIETIEEDLDWIDNFKIELSYWFSYVFTGNSN